MEIREKTRLINNVLSQTMDLYRTWAKMNNVNYNTLLVLYTLDDLKECTQKEISTCWALPKQTIHGILLDFEKKSYVTITTSDKNKKERLIRLTSLGKDYANTILGPLYSMEEAIMQAMGEDMQNQLINCNTRYYELFKEKIENAR